MKTLLTTCALMLAAFFAAGCVGFSIPKNLPGNGGWVISNVTIATPWGSWHAELIKAVENQNSNIPPFYGIRPLKPSDPKPYP